MDYMFVFMQGILVERLTSTLWPEYLDYKAVVFGLLERLDVIVKQSARLSCSVSIFSFNLYFSKNIVSLFC